MTTPAPKPSDMVVVANRLPFRRVETEGEIDWFTSPGGLIAALAPSMANVKQMAWIGWAGDITDESQDPVVVDDMQLFPIDLSAEDKDLHYDGMSNGTLWPLYHDKVAPVEFHRHWYEGYRRVNQQFAEAAVAAAAPGAQIWVHDYQLQLVPAMVRKLRPDVTIGFFLHIPFPPEELFAQMPWRSALIEGILGSDLVGFQTQDGADNFSRLAVALGLAQRDTRSVLVYENRHIHVQAFPIGIDCTRYDEGAPSNEVTNSARDLRARLGQPHTVLLGVDRLDYTKGIDVRLRAFKELLADGRLDPSRVTMVQVAEPSRDEVEAYMALRGRVEQLVGEINGDFGRVGFPVVHYVHQAQDFDELLSLYRAADVMVVTPFRDGMNLVAKEYVATRYDDTGVLVLSEFAGAAQQLTSAVLVNPYDIDGMKAAILRAVDMSPEEARSRMVALRLNVRQNDAVTWAKSFLATMPEPGRSSARSPGTTAPTATRTTGPSTKGVEDGKEVGEGLGHTTGIGDYDPRVGQAE